ncbi:MAG: hypothetical protein WKF89_11605 [Chitinophagaceae bacterium]
MLVVNAGKVLISIVLTGLTFLAVASIGGDKNKSKASSLKEGFTPLRTSRGFTLKAGPAYKGSVILKEERTANSVSYKSLITYTKGNSTYILPNNYKVSVASINTKSNLQLINLRIRLCK